MAGTRVVHCRGKPFDIYIGRPSKWGNPFKVGVHGDRRECIARYREWIATQPGLLADIGELQGQALGCWCAPKACHGDVLRELADYGERE